MRLEPLYRIRFTYPEGWEVGLEGGWEQHLYFAEGRCEGAIAGRFRGANFPRRAGPDGPLRPDVRAVIETHDGATIMVEWRGYGRAYPAGRRQIVGSVLHLSDRDPYRRLNDAVCVCVGEVRAATDPEDGPEQPDPGFAGGAVERAWTCWHFVRPLIPQLADQRGDATKTGICRCVRSWYSAYGG